MNKPKGIAKRVNPGTGLYIGTVTNSINTKLNGYGNGPIDGEGC